MENNSIYKFQQYLGFKRENPFITYKPTLQLLKEYAEYQPVKTTKGIDKKIQKKEIAGYDYKDPKNLDNQMFDQYLKGLKFEIEQNSKLSLEEAKDVVAKNLAKDSLYYMKNAAFDIKGIGYETSTEPKEPTGKHKSSGYGDLKENNMNKSTQLKELLEEAVAGTPSIGNPFAERKTKTYEDKFAAFLAEEKEKATKEAKETTDEGAEAEVQPKGKKSQKENKNKKKKFQEVVKEVEKLGEMAKAKVAMEVYGAKIKELKQTLESINEDSNLAEFIDETKTKELQNEIALYEKYHLNAEANYNNNSSHNK